MENLKIDNLFSVAGKIAIVSGGSRGIGFMIAQALVENGAKVYITSRKAGVCDAMHLLLKLSLRKPLLISLLIMQEQHGEHLLLTILKQLMTKLWISM